MTPNEKDIELILTALVMAGYGSHTIGDINKAMLAIDRIASGVDENKPAVFYCENGKNLEGLEQGALAVLSNLMIKTNADTAEFTIGNDNDGEFQFSCRRLHASHTGGKTE